MLKEFKIIGVSDHMIRGRRHIIVLSRCGGAWSVEAFERHILPIGTVVKAPSSQVDGFPNFGTFGFMNTTEIARPDSSVVNEVWSESFGK